MLVILAESELTTTAGERILVPDQFLVCVSIRRTPRAPIVLVLIDPVIGDGVGILWAEPLV